MAKTYRLTKAQREAIYAASLEGLNGREISEAAAAGDLGSKAMRAFEVSESYAREVARKVAAERGELYRVKVDADQPLSALLAIVKRQIELADKETTRLEGKQQRGKMGGQELDRLARATGSAIRNAQTLAQKSKSGSSRTPPIEPETPGKEPESEGDDWVASMLEDAGANPPPVADTVVRESAQNLGRDSDAPAPPLAANPDARTDKGKGSGSDVAAEIRRAAETARETADA